MNSAIEFLLVRENKSSSPRKALSPRVRENVSCSYHLWEGEINRQPAEISADCRSIDSMDLGTEKLRSSRCHCHLSRSPFRRCR